MAAVNPPTPEFDRLPDTAELPFLPLEAVWPGDRLDTTRRQPKTAVSSGYTRFREGDILLPKITPTFQADRTVIANGLQGGVGAGTTELHVIRAGPDADVRYLRYLLSSKKFLDEGEASMIGVAGQKRVPDDCLRDLRVPIVDPCCQRAIADYLDRETTRIDALIDKRQRQRTILEEHRLATIESSLIGESETGLAFVYTDNPFAPRIPSDWHVMRLKRVVRGIVDTAHATAPESIGGGYLVVRTTNVKEGHLLLEGGVFTDETTWREWTRRAQPQPGDVLLTREAPAGEACVVPADVSLCLGQRIVLLQTNDNFASGEWLVHSIYAGPARKFIALLSRSTTVAHINMSDIGDIPIVVAPPGVGERVLATLNERLHSLESLAASIDRQVGLLAEHRQALITAAVTGELEVPGVAA